MVSAQHLLVALTALVAGWNIVTVLGITSTSTAFMCVCILF